MTWWNLILNLPMAITLSVVLGICVAHMRSRGFIGDKEDSLLFSNLVAMASLFLAILLAAISVAALRGTYLICNSSSSNSLVNQSAINSCINRADSSLNLLGINSIMSIAFLIMLVIFSRPILYSDFEKKPKNIKWIIGIYLWSFLILAVFMSVFSLLSIVLYVSSM